MAFLSSVTRALLLVTISLTLIDLSQGLSCYNCVEPSDGRGVVTPSDALGSCNRRSAVDLGRDECKNLKEGLRRDAKCGYTRIQRAEGAIITRACIRGGIIDQMFGKTCDTGFTKRAHEEDPKIIEKRICVCDGDDCNAPDTVKNDDFPFTDIPKEKDDLAKLKEQREKEAQAKKDAEGSEGGPSGSGSLVTCWRMIFGVAGLAVGLALF